MEEKKTLDWSKREKELEDLLNKHRSKDGGFDCIVPVSGGKDGSYVAHTLRHKYKMNPLTITSRPPIELELGKKNIANFVDSGFDHMHITANKKAMRSLNKIGFIDMGSPYYGWLISIISAVTNVALKYEIPLIFYGEDGEVEYGGSSENKNRSIFSIEYVVRTYFEGGYDKIIKKSGLDKKELFWFSLPNSSSIDNNKISMTHMGYFEPWDSYKNYLVAKEHCGLEESNSTNSGTFTNFSQTDQALYSLHTYMMYLKFGFGRATQDAGIEIRRGAMDRDQAVNLVRLYDGLYPDEFIEIYLEYFDMTIDEFDAVLDKWVNKDLFEKINGRWKPLFVVK
jgi:N-acetyl sugar amidotransferase